VILYTTLLTSKHCGVNLAFEDFFLRSEKDLAAMYLVFYENFPALVLGKSLDREKEIWLHKRHPPVYRRISGGGSVIHADGNLNYSLFLSLKKFPEFMNVGISYEKILAAVASRLGPTVSRQGYSDLAIACRGGIRKFSGNAQCRKRGWIMHHGTLLYDKEAIRAIPYYLRPPPKEPEYRKGRRHGEFMTNILPSYNKHDLIRRVRLGIAEIFGAELRNWAFSPAESITPFQPE
jgi:lipoate-protein ligase A